MDIGCYPISLSRFLFADEPKRVSGIVEDRGTPFTKVHNPGHPDADEDGWVMHSNVDVFQEMVDLTAIERSFNANLASLRIYRGMLQNTVTNMRP